MNYFNGFPPIGRTTFNVSVIHFLLMFGFKLFSLYYPLYLVSIGLSVIKVGWVYLLINITIAIVAVLANFWIHKINPAKAASLGILGYGVYALIMLLNTAPVIFYSAQILLGFSAALWLVSLKSIIIESHPRNYNNSFGWFYSAPEYASAFAPAIGGLIIYKFGFGAVFTLSVIIQFINAAWAYYKLKDSNPLRLEKNIPIHPCHSRERGRLHEMDSTPVVNPVDKNIINIQTFNLQNLKDNYQEIFSSLKKDKITSFALVVVFIALIFSGMHRPYFVLFLKELNYTQNDIIGFLSLLSIAFIPLSWIVIRFISRHTCYKNISLGTALSGIIFIIIGLWSNFLNLIYIFIFILSDTIAELMNGSGKSSMLAEKVAKFKEEASTIDTILITVGSAIGSLIGGVAISLIGFNTTFLFGGLTVLIFASLFYLITKSNKPNSPVISTQSR